MEKVSIFTLRVQLIKEDGMKISKKETVKKSGPTGHSTMDSTYVARSTGKVCFSGPMAPSTKVIGRTIKCMAPAYSSGPMAGFIRGSITTIRSMGKEFTLGRILGCTLAGFIMANNTARGLTGRPVVKKFTEYGRKAKRPKYVKLTKSSRNSRTTCDYLHLCQKFNSQF